ncbi:MAG TPA: hypothetical protein DEF11_08140 [Shigella sp.]|nr:hypothetical protein [Shigella sp.]
MQFARGYSISWQSSFFRVVGLGYYVDHCATGLQQIRFIPSFSASQACRYPLPGFIHILLATCIQLRHCTGLR